MSITFDCTNKTPLTEGGEGIIYELGGQIIKIYKPTVNMKSKENKVKMLIKKSLPVEVVVPKDIVVDRKGKFIGFSMDKVEGEEFKKLANRKFVTANNITTKDILSMLVKAQNVVNELHKNGIYIGDLNDQNILFDKQFNIYFIDCDSWTVGDEKCEVAMDLFKDPLLKANDFNEETDTYSFSILIWKLLTRIHPFGGTMNPDMNIMDRMKNGISVINNPKVTIPKTIKSWWNLSPDLIEKLKDIFENKSREMSGELDEMSSNLKYCSVDNEYYYGKFSTCPLCDANAKVQVKPSSQGVMSGLKLFSILGANNIKMVMNEYSYLDTNDYIVDIRSGKKVKYQYGVRYYFTSDGYLVEDFLDEFVIHSGKEYRIEKKYKSQIVVEGNHIYYISKQNSLTDLTVLRLGNSIKQICKCSNIAYFEVKNGNYCVINYYFGKLFLNVNGVNTEIKYDSEIINYGIHYDEISSKWLVLLEDRAGKFKTYVLKNGKVDYETDQIKYTCQLSFPCISNSTLFLPVDGKIRGFSYAKSAFKDFECGVVNDGSKLIKKKNKFILDYSRHSRESG